VSFPRWTATLRDHPEATPAVLERVRTNLYTADFVHSVSREFVSTCQTPLLVLAGNDEPHPFDLAAEIARLSPNAKFISEWKAGPSLSAAIKRIREFLHAHAPQRTPMR